MEIFIDSNILIYYLLGAAGEVKKLQPVFSNTDNNIHISTQVVNEFCNVAMKKKLHSETDTTKFIEMFERSYVIETMNPGTTKLALQLKSKYQFSFYDSLIVASALHAGCENLYSQDLHHNLKIEKKLTIINPFK